MEDKIKIIFRELFNIKPEDFNEDLDMNSVIGWDSLNHLNIITALEESFNISLTTEEVIKMTNVKTIIEVLKEKNV